MSAPCDTNQAMAAVSYFRHAFGGWALPEQEQRAFLRMCRNFTPTEVQGAIDELVKTSGRRPGVNEVATKAKALRGKPQRRHGDAYLHEVSDDDLTPIADLPSMIAQLRDPSSALRTAS